MVLKPQHIVVGNLTVLPDASVSCRGGPLQLYADHVDFGGNVIIEELVVGVTAQSFTTGRESNVSMVIPYPSETLAHIIDFSGRVKVSTSYKL